MSNRFTDAPRYVVHAVMLERDGGGHRSLVLEHSHFAYRSRRYRIVAACTSSKAPNAARRLLSGECEERP